MEEYYQHDGGIHEIAVDPTTGNLWWAEWQRIKYMDESGQIFEVPFPNSDSSQGVVLSFGPDGTLFMLQYLPDDGNLLWHHRLYQRDTGGTWAELYSADGPDGDKHGGKPHHLP